MFSNRRPEQDGGNLEHGEAVGGVLRSALRFKQIVRPTSRLNARSSSTRPGPRPRWPAPAAAHSRAASARYHLACPPDAHDLHRRPALDRRGRVLDGSIRGIALAACVEQVLVFELKPGDTVTTDNRGSPQETCGARMAVEAAGARLLHLPPYRSNFGPAEATLAKHKALLRKTAQHRWLAERRRHCPLRLRSAKLRQLCRRC
jgi:transposase